MSNEKRAENLRSIFERAVGIFDEQRDKDRVAEFLKGVEGKLPNLFGLPQPGPCKSRQELAAWFKAFARECRKLHQ